MIAKVLRGDNPTAVSRRVGCNQNSGDAAEKAAWTHKREKETVQFLVLVEVENGNKNQLNRAKMEGKIRLWKNAAHFVRVDMGEIENFDKLGKESAVEKDSAKRLKALFSHEKEEQGDADGGNADEKEMF